MWKRLGPKEKISASVSTIAILISGISLLLSAYSVWWNTVRKIDKLQAKVMSMDIYTHEEDYKPRIELLIMNSGNRSGLVYNMALYAYDRSEEDSTEVSFKRSIGSLENEKLPVILEPGDMITIKYEGFEKSYEYFEKMNERKERFIQVGMEIKTVDPEGNSYERFRHIMQISAKRDKPSFWGRGFRLSDTFELYSNKFDGVGFDNN